MDSKEIQKLVDETFTEHFGYTPLNERVDDIFREALELSRFTDVKNIKEEAGDLLSSLIKLCAESGWSFEELIKYTCTEKIPRRKEQYKSLGRKTKVAILGGAFNPVTEAHIKAAQLVLNTSGQFDEVWLMPSYNHMYNKQLLPFEERFKMCELAAQADGRIKVFDYEKRHELGGETYHLMKRLMNDDEYENFNFSMIIGLDNALTFDKWVNYVDLERLCRFVVIPRKGYKFDPENNWFLREPHIYLNGENNVPELSSTHIRNIIGDDENTSLDLKNKLGDFLNNDVLDYIIDKDFYV